MSPTGNILRHPQDAIINSYVASACGINLAEPETVNRLAPRHLALLLLLGLIACSGDNGDKGSITVPQPVPLLIRESVPGAHNATTLVVGLPGAVAGAGTVTIRDRRSAAEATAGAASAGSFSSVLTLAKDHELEIRFQNEDGASDWVAIPSASATDGVSLTVPNSDGPKPVSAPDAQGQVTVTSDAGAGKPPLIEATPEVDLIVANTDNGGVVASVTDQSGHFTVRLPGAVGDVIQILLVDPEDTKQTSDYLSYEVPAP
jgi:hypothetical protein